jgi:hypothetical protein
MNHISLLYFSQNSSEMVLLPAQDIFQFRTSGTGASGVSCREVQVKMSAACASCTVDWFNSWKKALVEWWWEL